MSQADARVVLRPDIAEVVGVGLESWVILVVDVFGSLVAEGAGLAPWISAPLEDIMRLHENDGFVELSRRDGSTDGLNIDRIIRN